MLRRARIIAATVLVVSIVGLSGCAAASLEAESDPSQAPVKRTSTPTPEPTYSLDAAATCADVLEFPNRDVGIGLITEVFGTAEDMSDIIFNACAIEVEPTTTVSALVEGSTWRVRGPKTEMTVDGGTLAGYTIEYQLDPGRIGVEMEGPATALGTTQFMPTMSGQLTVTNTTFDRPFPIGGSNALIVRGAYPADSPICTLNTAIIDAAAGCTHVVGVASMSVPELAAREKVQLEVGTPSGTLTVVPDDQLENVKQALALPQSIGLYWIVSDAMNSPRLSFANCRLPISGFASGPSYIVLTLPAGQETTFCA